MSYNVFVFFFVFFCFFFGLVWFICLFVCFFFCLISTLNTYVKQIREKQNTDIQNWSSEGRRARISNKKVLDVNATNFNFYCSNYLVFLISRCDYLAPFEQNKVKKKRQQKNDIKEDAPLCF